MSALPLPTQGASPVRGVRSLGFAGKEFSNYHPYPNEVARGIGRVSQFKVLVCNHSNEIDSSAINRKTRAQLLLLPAGFGNSCRSGLHEIGKPIRQFS